MDDATCEHKNPGDLYFFRGKKRRRFSSMCDVRCFKPIVRFSCHLTLFFFFFFPPFSSFLSTGRLDSGDGWFVKSIGKSRSFSVTSSTPDCDRPFHVSVRATDFFFSFSIYLSHTFSFHFVVTVPKEKEEEERISGLYPAAGHSNV